MLQEENKDISVRCACRFRAHKHLQTEIGRCWNCHSLPRHDHIVALIVALVSWKKVGYAGLRGVVYSHWQARCRIGAAQLIEIGFTGDQAKPFVVEVRIEGYLDNLLFNNYLEMFQQSRDNYLP
jgi:hypothetical protein